MAEQTGIQWCDHTFNGWVGCTKVSPACDHCYAEALMDHRHHRVEWGGERSLTSDANWRQPLRWNRAAREAGIRRKVFCASLADVFDNQVPEVWRHRLWALIAICPDIDWLLLTKRPQNIVKMLPGSDALQIANKTGPGRMSGSARPPRTRRRRIGASICCARRRPPRGSFRSNPFSAPSNATRRGSAMDTKTRQSIGRS